MYIVALLFDNDKRDENFKVVSKQTTKDKLYTINQAYPLNGTFLEKQSWYNTYKKFAKFYKNQGSAIRLVNRLEKEYNITGYHVMEINDKITTRVYDGCPNCGSFEVVETNLKRYERMLEFDPETKTMKTVGFYEDTSNYISDDYKCCNCGYDLSNCTFNFD